MTKKKIIATAVSAALSASVLLGGTMAWQSINQEALNEVSGIVNPGGRLHDDFNGVNKDVYVENFADENIFARVRLDEYLELIGNNNVKTVLGNPAATADNKSMYTTYIPADDNLLNTSNPFRDYVDWSFGGGTVYMPTTNQNKDSLAADVNGTFAGPDGNETTPSDAFLDYRVYEAGEAVNIYAVVDADTNDVDEIAEKYDINYLIRNDSRYDLTLQEYVNNNIIFLYQREVTAQPSPYAKVMTMQQWLQEGSPVGDIWVYDADGWAYYAQPIAPGTASGLLLDGINVRVDDDYHYAINVVAQFVTANDVGVPASGDTPGTGFYDEEHGAPPTDDALGLLEKIGAIASQFTMSAEPQADGTYLITNTGATGEVRYQVFNATDTENTIITVVDGEAYLQLGPAEQASEIIVRGIDSQSRVYDLVMPVGSASNTTQTPDSGTDGSSTNP